LPLESLIIIFLITCQKNLGNSVNYLTLMRLGKNKQAIIVLVFLFLSASAGGQTGKKHKYHLGGDLQKNSISSESHRLVINYSLSEINLENIVNNHGIFYRVSIPGHTPASVPGKPEFPIFSRLISIPEGAEYKVTISEVKTSRIHPSRKKFKGLLIPAQEGETKIRQQHKPAFVIDNELYASKSVISSDTVRIEPLGRVRGKKLNNLYISPVRYNPHSNLLEVINSMKIEITFTYPDSNYSKSQLTESVLFSESPYKSLLNSNKEDLIPGFSDQPVRMVIITDTAFEKHLEPFIKWKTQKGFKLNILYKGASHAGDSYLQLKDTLTKIYHASDETNPPPEYLLIIGDVDKIPYYGTGQVTDMYYGEFDGSGDYMPEMYIGRLPVADTTELKNVVKKLIQYEKFEFADTNKFYSRALVTAGNDGSYANTMNGQVDYAISNYLNIQNNIKGYNFYYPQSASAEDSILKLINGGVSYINYTGHGDVSGWLDPTIKIKELDSLKNRSMYPFVISNACQTSRFNTNSFGNKFVVSGEKGAIGFIGCSNDSYWDEDFYWSVGIGSISANPTYEETGPGIYDRLFHTHGEAASDWYFTMGQIIYAGNLAVSASTSPRKKYYWETYNLVGDPSVTPILGTPDSFNITLPDTLPNGLTSISINAPPFSYIAVSHFDTLWDASHASPSGSAILDLPGLSDDSCMVVITGQNKKPLIKTIYFSEINDEYINLKAFGINDNLGNDNNKADFGESFFLSLTVSNLGLTDATELHAKISTTSDWITINNDSVSIGTLTAGSEIILPDDLEMTIAEDVPDMEVVTIQLTLKDQVTEKHYNIDITVHAPDLQILNCIMDGNGDFIADPGETLDLIFKIINTGSGDISGDLYVESSNPEIQIQNEPVKSGILKSGETTSIPVTIKIPTTISAGNLFTISSKLDCNPYILEKDFSFRAGRIRESFEAGTFNVFPWINISSKPWIITESNSFDGNISARSGLISHKQSSSLVIRTEYAQADSIKFLYKVSSEKNYDFFVFKLNDTEVFRKSGETTWEEKVVGLPAGYNKMEWIYIMDEAITGGSNCVLIDLIDFAETSSITYIKNDLQVARIVTPVQIDARGKAIVSVKVLNRGKDTIDGFNLAYNIDNSYPVSQYFKQSVIPYGDSVTVSFITKTYLAKLGIYNFTAYGLNNHDDYLLNDTISIDVVNDEIKDSLIIFPNPFTDEFTVFINSRIEGKVNISITRLSGSKVYEIEKDVLTGKNEIIISDIHLGPALYYLNIRGDVINKTIPILKVNK
jgi:Peptidase family C25/Propeptide_C25/Peptidase family C25, C terminal ig-like domain/Secretion system C-terminal sorting domain